MKNTFKNLSPFSFHYTDESATDESAIEKEILNLNNASFRHPSQNP